MASPKLFWQTPHFVTSLVQADIDGRLAHRIISNASIILQGRDVALNNLFLAPSSLRSTTLQSLNENIFLTKKKKRH